MIVQSSDSLHLCNNKTVALIISEVETISLINRKAVEGLVRADSQEVREIVDRAVAKQESLQQQIIKDYQEK